MDHSAQYTLSNVHSITWSGFKHVQLFRAVLLVAELVGACHTLPSIRPIFRPSEINVFDNKFTDTPEVVKASSVPVCVSVFCFFLWIVQYQCFILMPDVAVVAIVVVVVRLRITDSE